MRLLTSGLCLSHIVNNDHDQSVPIWLHEVCNIKSKRSVSSDMLAYMLSIEPHICLVIDRSEMKQYSFFLHTLWQIEITRVTAVIMELLIIYAAQDTFRSERNDYLGVERLICALFVEGKLPNTIQVQPVLPASIRPWMLWPRNIT